MKMIPRLLAWASRGIQVPLIRIWEKRPGDRFCGKVVKLDMVERKCFLPGSARTTVASFRTPTQLSGNEFLSQQSIFFF